MHSTKHIGENLVKICLCSWSLMAPVSLFHDFYSNLDSDVIFHFLLILFFNAIYEGDKNQRGIL